MANKIILKKSSVPSKVPLQQDLEYGELAINYADGLLYFKNSNNEIKYFNSGVSSGGGGNDNSGSYSIINWGDLGGTLSNQTDLQNALNAKQATLVSGSTIKTINGISLLGSGDITISGGSDGNVSVSIGTSPPQSPGDGDLWWNSEDANLYVYYNDGDSSQWVGVSRSIKGDKGDPGIAGTLENVYFLQGTTSNNTETELFVNGELGNRITVPVDSSMYYTIDVTCRRTDGSDFAAFTLKSVVSNAGDIVSDVGSVYEIVVARTDASISVDARADDANNSIGVYVTGVTGKSFTWKAQVTVVEV